ncbi:helix-turn-helix transcriptional regulator [Streptomyces sp. NPDC049949]|uniref:helix-turn-helix transcriptional regulator n=1 Tax=Streptomyces sp. NPDC049949 TaxID=3154627 RepID=UPI00343B5D51
MIQHAGPELTWLRPQLRQAVAVWPSVPARAAAEVWAALWRVAQLAPARERNAQAAHPAVTAAVALIEVRLGRPLTVPDIASAAGFSHNHLTRLFRAATGEAVVGYIRTRRMERSRHFLQATTLSAPAVAASVGIPDLQVFNKACRRTRGASPRGIRAARPASPHSPDQ